MAAPSRPCRRRTRSTGSDEVDLLAASDPSEAASAAPLLDQAALRQLRANIPGPRFQALVGRALTGTEEACARMAPGDRARLAQEAHRLRGTAGSFDFKRIAAVAGRLEEQMVGAGNPEPLLTDLKRAARDTRAALEDCLTGDVLTLH